MMTTNQKVRTIGYLDLIVTCENQLAREQMFPGAADRVGQPLVRCSAGTARAAGRPYREAHGPAGCLGRGRKGAAARGCRASAGSSSRPGSAGRRAAGRNGSQPEAVSSLHACRGQVPVREVPARLVLRQDVPRGRLPPHRVCAPWKRNGNMAICPFSFFSVPRDFRAAKYARLLLGISYTLLPCLFVMSLHIAEMDFVDERRS